jgi:hypothetical protein
MGMVYLIWQQCRDAHPPHLRKDRERVLVDLNVCDRLIALNHSNSVVDSQWREAKHFSHFTNAFLSEYTGCFLFVNRKPPGRRMIVGSDRAGQKGLLESQIGFLYMVILEEEFTRSV